MDCQFVAVGAGKDGRTRYRCSRCQQKEYESHQPPERIHRQCHGGTLAPPALGEGPGTELKKLLGAWGIEAEGSCACDKHARQMNERGVAWCQANVPTIMGWMKQEAELRKLPFVSLAARLLVQRAISNARRRARSLGN